MDNFAERLINERIELAERKNKLKHFVDSDKFYSIDKTQQSLLKIQLNAMETYHEVLMQRINHLRTS